MKIVKILIATVALSGALVTTANARDSFSIGINIGGHDHHARHTLRTHRHAPVYYGHHYSAPRIVYYAPSVRYRHNGYYGNRHRGYADRGYSDRHHYKRHGNKHYRSNHDGGRGRGHNRR